MGSVFVWILTLPMNTKKVWLALIPAGIFFLRMIPKMSIFQKWVKTTASVFTARFQDPLLRSALAGDVVS